MKIYAIILTWYYALDYCSEDHFQIVFLSLNKESALNFLKEVKTRKFSNFEETKNSDTFYAFYSGDYHYAYTLVEYEMDKELG